MTIIGSEAAPSRILGERRLTFASTQSCHYASVRFRPQADIAGVTRHSSEPATTAHHLRFHPERRVTERHPSCPRSQEMIVEKAYWLGRKRASLKLAQNATDSEARLIHYDLAGRYSVKAAEAGARSRNLAEILPPLVSADRKSPASDDA